MHGQDQHSGAHPGTMAGHTTGHPGGAPGNFLAALSAYGKKTAFLAKVGDNQMKMQIVKIGFGGK